MWPNASIGTTHELTKLTCVCRHWREVAVTYRSLWTNISDRSWVLDMMLKRSGTASLKVRVKDVPTRSAVDLFSSAGSRIQELYLLNVNNMLELNCGDGIEKYINFTPTRLQHLTLATDGDRRDYNISPRLFASDAPNLRSLTLQSLSWLPQNQFFNLTQLCIYDRRRGGPNYECFMTAFQVSEFLAFLAGCPKLQDLTLVDIWVDSRRDREEDAQAVVTLNNLRRLSLGRMIPRLVLFLVSHVVNPAGVATRIFGMTCGDREFLPRLSTMLPIQGMNKLHLSVGPGKSFIFAPTTASRGLRVEFNQCPMPCTHCQEWASHLWAHWSLLSVRELWLTDRLHLSRFMGLERLVRNLPNVTTLFICQFETDEQRRANFRSELDRLIITLTTPRPSPADYLLFCPHLTTLHVWFCEQPVEPSLLVKFAAARAQLGHPIQHLIIECAHPGPYDSSLNFDSAFAVLKTHVNRVDFIISSEPPAREVPLACTTGIHEFWPAW